MYLYYLALFTTHLTFSFFKTNLETRTLLYSDIFTLNENFRMNKQQQTRRNSH